MSESTIVELPFSFALNTVWGKLDDFVLFISIILISVPIILKIGPVVQNYFKYSLWTGQMITFSLLTSVFLFLFSRVAGETSAVSILQGFALGVGYALQPYIVSLLSGATYFATGMISSDDIIVINEKEYIIVSNGVLYIEAIDIIKNIRIFIPNNFFNEILLEKKDIKET
jgi:hypothetical protein